MSEAELREEIIAQLKTVFDPEIPVNIWELGLVYAIKVKENNRIGIDMTLTAPGCPVAGDIIREVDEKVRAIENVSDVDVHLTFDPPWNKEMMSEEARLELGFL